MVESLPDEAGDAGGTGSMPGSGRSAGRGNGKPLQCSCLENPMDRGTWQATVHSVAQSRTQLKQLSSHALQTDCSIVALQSHCVGWVPRLALLDSQRGLVTVLSKHICRVHM